MDTPLRKVRRESGKTLVEVARAIEYDPGNLSRLERGQQRTTPEVAERLVRFFGGRITELEILYPERFAHRKAS